MRWAIKLVIPTGEDDSTVEWDYQTTQVLARSVAVTKRLPTLPTGTRVHVHRCYNDEPDETRRGCVVTDAWEKRDGPTWVKVV